VSPRSRRNLKASQFPYFATPFACFAHRGGFISDADRGKENTLHAFRQAAKLGYRYLETDLHATRDGVLVAFHDRFLDRVSNGHGLIRHKKYAEIQQILVADHEPIPTLADLLDEFPDHFFNVDLKEENAIDPLVALIKATGCYERLCVGSFSLRRLSAFRRKIDRPIATSYSIPEVIAAKLGSYWPRLLRLPGAALQIPVRTPLLGVPVPVLSRHLLQAAHAADVRVQIWTVNDADLMRQLIWDGVDGIMTDHIATLKQVSQQIGCWYGDA